MRDVSCLRSWKLYFTLLMAATIIMEVSAFGVVNVQLDHYTAKEDCDTLGAGSFFDILFATGSKTCDMYFLVCMKGQDDNLESWKSCEFGVQNTGVFPENNDVALNTTFSFAVNEEWGGILNMMVFAIDYDGASIFNIEGDDELQGIWSLMMPLEFLSDPMYFNENIEGNELTYSVEFHCSPGWFGSLCNIWCVPEVDDHFSCSSDGHRICKDGWQGSSCNIPINNCFDTPCHENATCNSVGPANYACLCDYGFEGDGIKECSPINFCETDYTCDKHAFCSYISPGNHKCTCEKGYAGDGVTCDEINSCEIFNGGCDSFLGQCISTGPLRGTNNCTCSDGYQGDGVWCEPEYLCSYPDFGGCVGNAICVYLGVHSTTCMCPMGYVNYDHSCEKASSPCSSPEDFKCIIPIHGANEAGGGISDTGKDVNSGKKIIVSGGLCAVLVLIVFAVSVSMYKHRKKVSEAALNESLAFDRSEGRDRRRRSSLQPFIGTDYLEEDLPEYCEIQSVPPAYSPNLSNEDLSKCDEHTNVYVDVDQ